jgi:transcriptional regulator with XRE-family HTH domain
MRKSTPKDPKTLGGMICEARQQAEMTLLDLAKKIKTHNGTLSEGYLSAIESNKKTPSYEVALQITKELNINFTPIKAHIDAQKWKKTINITGYGLSRLWPLLINKKPKCQLLIEIPTKLRDRYKAACFHLGIPMRIPLVKTINDTIKIAKEAQNGQN